MSPNVITSVTTRSIKRVLFASALLLFAAVIAPVCALMVACSMPCCEGKSFLILQSATAGACAEHCAISNNTASHELPNAVAPSSETVKFALASLAVAEASESLAPKLPPSLPAHSLESHHAVPGDAPVYLYNSVFLI